MRVLVWIVHDADDRNSVAANLPGDIAVEILRRHNRNLILGRMDWGGRTKSQHKGEANGAFHKSISLSGSRKFM
jgi:hypothetical protein